MAPPAADTASYAGGDSTNLRDTTSGTNRKCGADCTAAAGDALVTGLGSPISYPSAARVPRGHPGATHPSACRPGPPSLTSWPASGSGGKGAPGANPAAGEDARRTATSTGIFAGARGVGHFTVSAATGQDTLSGTLILAEPGA